MWCFRVGSFAVALLLASAGACGGRTRGDGSDEAPSVSAGRGGASGAGVGGSRPVMSAGGATPTVVGATAAVAGSGAGAPVAGSGAGAAEANSDLSNSCPQALGNRSCPAAEIDIRFTRDAVDPRTGVWVEPLQIPDYAEGSRGTNPEIEPSKWDRSPLPAGACVLRIHGLSGACLRPAILFQGTCASLADTDASHVAPGSYYDAYHCLQGVAPGCPTASTSDSRNGYWWYFVARGEDTDLVVCAPECGPLGSFAYKQGCLRLAGSG